MEQYILGGNIHLYSHCFLSVGNMQFKITHNISCKRKSWAEKRWEQYVSVKKCS